MLGSTWQLGRAAAVHLPPLPLGARGMAQRKTLIKGAPTGWPRRSPDGWFYARWLKKTHPDDYLTKQQFRRVAGKELGEASRSIQDAIRREPAYDIVQ